jgi:HlyD family secretion protein
MSNRRTLILCLTATVSLTLMVESCGRDKAVPGGSGFIEATETTISAEIAGQIKSLRFDEGQAVSTGDTIAVIDTLSTALRLGQAESGLEAAGKRVTIAAIAIEQAAYNADLAGKDYERAKALVSSGSVDQQHFDQVETAYKQAVLGRRQAEAALESARADLAKSESDVKLLHKQLSDCFPRASAPGVVTTRFVRAGEWIGTGQPIVKVASLDTVWVKVYLPAGDLTRIKLGDEAVVDPEDGRSKPLGGSVTWISDQAEFTPKNVQTREARADLVYAVKVTIPNRDGVLKIGMPVSVAIR